MSPVPALRKTPLTREELARQRDELHQQQMGLLLPAMNHASGRTPKKLKADEIATIIALNEAITALDQKLGRSRH